MIIGGHPHRLQGTTFVGDVPIAYSLGNFWFSTGTLYTTLAKVTITEDGTVKLSFVPCIQQNLTTRILTEPEERSDFYEYLASVSMDIGIDADGVVYNKMQMIILQERFYMTLIQARQILSVWLIMRETRLILSET